MIKDTVWGVILNFPNVRSPMPCECPDDSAPPMISFGTHFEFSFPWSANKCELDQENVGTDKFEFFMGVHHTILRIIMRNMRLSYINPPFSTIGYTLEE